MFHFATCNRQSALQFIRKVYPNKKIEDTPESAGPLLDFVAKDIVRVQDPMMHGNRIAIIPGNNWNNDMTHEIQDACKKFAQL